MLNPEQAKERLQALRISDWKEQRVASIANLPEALRILGWGILGRNSSGEPERDWQVSYDAQNTALKQLDALNAEDRLTIFAILFPQLFRQVEQAWQLLTRLPYQSGWQRKA